MDVGVRNSAALRSVEGKGKRCSVSPWRPDRVFGPAILRDRKQALREVRKQDCP
jgi:hypothetical protein